LKDTIFLFILRKIPKLKPFTLSILRFGARESLLASRLRLNLNWTKIDLGNGFERNNSSFPEEPSPTNYEDMNLTIPPITRLTVQEIEIAYAERSSNAVVSPGHLFPIWFCLFLILKSAGDTCISGILIFPAGPFKTLTEILGSNHASKDKL
jgi:hypothetical protein